MSSVVTIAYALCRIPDQSLMRAQSIVLCPSRP